MSPFVRALCRAVTLAPGADAHGSKDGRVDQSLRDEKGLVTNSRRLSDGVARTLELLEKKFGKITYALAKNEGLIPARGFLRETGEMPYSLHGAGVNAYVDGLDVAFDFWPQVNNHVGFGTWQLAMFTRVDRKAYAEFAEPCPQNPKCLMPPHMGLSQP